MYIAEKANRRVRIPDEKKDEYIGMGYTVKNMDGSVVKEPENPKKEAETLKKENASLKAELEKAASYAEATDKRIAELEAQLKASGEENENLKAKLEEATKYAESADKRIAELEAGQKTADVAATGGKGTKAK